MRRLGVLLLALAGCAREMLGCVGDEPVVTPAPASDASVDTGLDSTSFGEGAVDGAPAATLCSTVDADFCEDFDRATTAPWSFTELDLSAPTATVISNTGAFTSAPRSATVRIPEGDGGFRGAYLIGRLPVTGRSIKAAVLELDFRLDLVEERGQTSVSDLFLVNTDSNGGIALHLQTNEDAGATLSFSQMFTALPKPLATPSWNHLKLDVRFDAPDASPSLATAIATLNGSSTTATGAAVVIARPKSTIGIYVGAASISGLTPKIFLSVDNVTARVIE